MNLEIVLIKLTLGQETEQSTRWQELAIKSMKEPGRQTERHTGSSRETWSFVGLFGLE